MVDADTRRAARIAAMVALPLAVVAGIIAFQIMSPDEPDEPSSTATSARPVPSTPVEVAAPPLPTRPAAVCRALLSKLPDHFGDLLRRPVTAGPEQNAAYGEPAVTVACGTAGPTPPAGAQYFEIQGICWYQDDAAGARRWTLQGREVPILVTAPSGFLGQDLVDLAKPISEAIPEVTKVCQ
jgi:hypothetical protein